MITLKNWSGLSLDIGILIQKVILTSVLLTDRKAL